MGGDGKRHSHKQSESQGEIKQANHEDKDIRKDEQISQWLNISLLCEPVWPSGRALGW